MFLSQLSSSVNPPRLRILVARTSVAAQPAGHIQPLVAILMAKSLNITNFATKINHLGEVRHSKSML